MQQHKDKIAFVAGGTRGIGRAIALHLAQDNVGTLFINYLENDENAAETKTLLEQYGVKVYLLKYNLAFPMEINAMFEAIKVLTQHLDYVVHCVALTTFKPLAAVKPNQWDLTMNVSARSFLGCAQNAAPLMKNGGGIVAISSTGSQRYNANYGALGVAKATLESIVKYLAVELATQNIRVNGVVSGLILGDKLPPFPNIEDIVDETIRRTPAGRLGTPEDVAEMVHFMLTKAKWLCGQNIILDGGFCLT